MGAYLVFTSVQHDLIDEIGFVFQMTSTPILRHGIRKDPSRVIERSRNDRSTFILKRYSTPRLVSLGERKEEEPGEGR